MHLNSNLRNGTSHTSINSTWIYIAILRKESINGTFLIKEQEIGWESKSLESNKITMALNISDPLSISQGGTNDELLIHILDHDISDSVFFSDALNSSLHKDYF